ncbi:STAS domain-containing protein [Streptodolium elevatio]
MPTPCIAPFGTPTPVSPSALLHPFLNVSRRDTRDRAVVTLAGDIDPDSEALLRLVLARCLADGVRAIDVDLAQVAYCGCCGLRVFLEASAATAAAGGILRLRRPGPLVTRLLDVTGTTALLFGLPATQIRAPHLPAPADALFDCLAGTGVPPARRAPLAA